MTQRNLPTEFALNIAERQYFKKDKDNKPLEDYDGMLRRVARHSARAEAIDAYKRDNGRYPEWYISYEGRRKNLLDLEKLDSWIESQGYAPLCKKWEDEFYNILAAQKFSPGGRILAGSESQYGQLANCFVLSPNGRHINKAKDDADSIDGIYELSYKLAKVTKTGGGCGINLDFMRESGSFVEGSGGRSSGPVSFLRLNYNTTLRVIKLEGVRRGAGMATMSLTHPDVLDFITAKDRDREEIEGSIEAFNISLLVTNHFMETVKQGGLWRFTSVATGEYVAPSPVPGKYHLPGESPTNVTGNPNDPTTSKEIPLKIVEGSGHPAVPARWIWNEICNHAWESGDPGIIFISKINENWPLHTAIGPITATNPCGEEPLAPGESCCLGSMILDRYYADGSFDWENFEKDIHTAVRFLDNVLTITTHPIEDTQEWCDRLRRVGLGVMGDATLMMKLQLGYGSEEAQQLRQDIGEAMAKVSQEASEKLAKEKGAFPFWEKIDDWETIPARRNIYTLSIAPTGTISMVADTTSGIEPLFALAVQRRVGSSYMLRLDPHFENYLRTHRPDINLTDESEFIAVDLMVGHDSTGGSIRKSVMVPKVVKQVMNNKGSIQGLDDLFTKEEQAIFVTAHDVIPSEHVKVQGIWQKTMDSTAKVGASISKTINLPNSATVEDVKKIYELGYDAGLKGITMYRDGSKDAQVLRTDLGETKKVEKKEVKPAPTPVNGSDRIADGTVVAHRPRRTSGDMVKAEFRDATGRERKVYVFVGLDDVGIPVEVFITDEDGGHDVHPYAAALGKMISMSLKYGAPAAKVADKLSKIEGGSVSFSGAAYQSVPAMVGKLINEAIEEVLQETGISLDDGDSRCKDGCNMIHQSGCKVCTKCGYSVCM